MNYFGILMILNHIYNGLWDVLTPKLWTQCQRSESTNSSLSVLHFFQSFADAARRADKKKMRGKFECDCNG